MQEQLIRFFCRGRPVVAGDSDFNISGDEGTFKGLDALENIVDYIDGIRPRALGDTQGYRSLFGGARATAKENVINRLGLGIKNSGDITQVN